MVVLLRLVRSEMLEVMGQEYVRTARAKGVPEFWVTIRHGLKNAAIPVITVMGLQFGALVQGAIVVEPIFAWPGLGWLLVESIAARDFPVVVAGAIIAAVFVTLVNLIVDLLYGWLDPRIRVNSDGRRSSDESSILLGTRGGAAHTGVGEHALRCAWLPECRLVDGYLPRDRHCLGGVGRQLHGR
jgi:Binding-protein-dependent transport system inner membrane component